jgi:Zn-dependent protease with chaperone function
MAPILELLWQWSGLALVAWCVLRALRRSGASIRYALLWASAGAALLLPLLRRTPGSMGPSAGDPASPIGYALQIVLPASLDGWVFPLMAAWGAAAALLLLRLAARVRGMVRLRRRCVAAPESLLARLDVPIGRRGYAGELLLCDEVPVPSVLGFFRPAIVMSRDLAHDLSDDELDQIVLHEWAHIVRRDQWTRLAQALLECVGFFHPATWWLSRRLDLEREIACDEWVTSHTGAPRVYASALTAVAGILAGSRRLGTAPQTGASSSEIAGRVERVLRGGKMQGMPASWAWGTALMLFGSGVLIVHHSTPAFATEISIAGQAAELQEPATGETKPAASILVPTPRAAARVRETARVRPLRSAVPEVTGTEIVPSEPAVRTDIGVLASAGFDSQPRSVRLHPTLIAQTAQLDFSPAQTRQDRAWGVDVSGFRSLGTAMARGGKEAGGFFQKLAVSARDSF